MSRRLRLTAHRASTTLRNSIRLLSPVRLTIVAHDARRWRDRSDRSAAPQPRQCAILIRPRQPAVADDVERPQVCSELARFPHC